MYLYTQNAFLLICIIVVFASCKKEERIEPCDILQNKTYTQDVRIEGHEFDSLLIKDCVFDGATLSIGNVNHLIIRQCTFKNIKGTGLKIAFIGPVQHVVIDNCDFENIGYSAIDSHEEAYDCVIQNCSFRDVALSEIGPAMGQPHHAIYWKGKNVAIVNNYFFAGQQPFGNAISIRSSGIVSGNIISHSPQNGIMYFADHPGGDTLLIENNFLVNNAFSITVANDDNNAWLNKNVIIRFNSMIQPENRSIYVSEGFQNITNIEIYGNLIINPTSEFFKTFYTISPLYSNFTATSFDGFVNSDADDLHLQSITSAHDFCTEVSLFPLYDIDGDIRNSGSLNAGADE